MYAVRRDLRTAVTTSGCLCLWSRCPLHGEGTGLTARAFIALEEALSRLDDHARAAHSQEPSS
jgi:hypothetical protein